MIESSMQKDVLNRLKTVKGHLGGIEKMIEEGQSCSDVLMQLGAIRSALNKVSGMIAEHYAVDCYETALNEGTDPREVMKKAIQTLTKFNGC